MPSIYAVGYPVNIDTGETNGATYTISVDGQHVFTGRSIKQIIDIAPILRNYLNADRIVLDWPTGAGINNLTEQLNAGIAKITGVKSADSIINVYIDVDNEVIIENDANDHLIIDLSGIDDTIFVANDYNIECKTEYGGYPYITTVFVRGEIDHRQICFFGANTSQNQMTLKITRGGVNPIEFTKTYESPSVILRATIGYVEQHTAIPVVFSLPHTTGAEWDRLEAVQIPCSRAQYALYAVNRRGGVTHLLCEGTTIESFSRTDWDIETAYDRLSQVGRGNKRMNTQTTRKWQLNTGFISEEETKHIDDIVNSPHVVLHDLAGGRLFAVNSTDKSIDRLTRKSNGNRPIEYTLNFEEARTEIRW